MRIAKARRIRYFPAVAFYTITMDTNPPPPFTPEPLSTLTAPPNPSGTIIAANGDEKNLGILMHGLTLIGLPFLGPLIVWLLKKDVSPYLDAQGREVLNFHISLFLYFFVAFLLVFVVIGIPLLFLLSAASLVLTIIGIVKAVDGTLYRFPLIIRLL